jgi:tetratricopeptide (TPR) repeat protein
MSASVFFYYLLLAMFGQWRLAAFASLLFALHPVQAESVNFLAGGRNTLLCAVSVLGSMLLHIKGRRAASALALIPGVLSKEFALIMPGAILVHRLLSRGDHFSLKAFTREMSPHLAIIALYLAARTLVVGGLLGFDAGNVAENILRAPYVMTSYLRLALVPMGLSSNHLLAHGLPLWPVLAGLAVFLLLSAAAYRARRYAPAAAGFLWAMIFLLPVSGIIPLGEIEMADRYAYLAMAGVAMTMGYLLASLPGNKAPIAILAALIVIFTYTDYRRSLTWKDNRTLYNRMIADTPGSAFGYYNLGIEEFRRGELDRSRELLEKVLTMLPREKTAAMLPVKHQAYVVLASVYRLQGSTESAISMLEKALLVAPRDMRARAYLAALLNRSGRRAEAESVLENANMDAVLLQRVLDHRAGELHEKGLELYRQGRMDDALRNFLLALEYNSESAETYFHAGLVYAQKSNFGSAIKYFERAALLRPESLEANYNLSLALMLAGQREEARRYMNAYMSLGGRQTMESGEILGSSPDR